MKRILAAAMGIWLVYAAIPTAIARKKPKAKSLVLTFDDGPDGEVTPLVMDALEERGERGMFFVLGKKAAERSGLIHAMVQRGHAVAIHGWDHKSAWRRGPLKTVRDLERTYTLLDGMGVKPAYYRGPYGRYNLADLLWCRKRSVSTLHWDGIHGDWRKRAPGVTARSLVKKHKKGGVAVLHDGTEGRAEPGANRLMVADLARFLDEA